MSQILTLPRRSVHLRPLLWLLPPLLVLATLFFYPLLLIGEQALRDTEGHLGLETFWQVVESRRFLSALLNTLQIAVIATSGCLLLGSVLALILVFIPFPGSQLISRIIDTFIALPTFLITLAFTFIYGSAGLLNGTLMSLFAFELPPVDFLYSIQGVILAEMTVFTPLVMRPLMAGLRQIDKSQLEAASILGAHPLRVIGQVIFPAVLPALMAGGSLCLLLTTNEFGIVLFIGAKGVNTLPMMVYSKAILESDYSVACMIALINILLSLGLFMLYRLAAARTGVRSIWSRKGRTAAGALAVTLFAGFFFLPLAVILMSSLSQQWNGLLPSGFTFGHFVNAFRGAAWDALFSSLMVGFCASLFALLCGMWAALSLRQYGAKLQKYLGLMFYLPSAIPSVSVGLGILVAFSQGPLQMNGTFWIVLAAHFVLISAFTFSNVSTGLARISADIENVASSLGASPWYRLRYVTLPLMTPWMISALALSLSLSMGELGATVMIYPPGWTTLPVTIFSLTDRGNIADGSALTIVLVGVTLLLMIKLERIARRMSQR